jgi:hypothetical protein
MHNGSQNENESHNNVVLHGWSLHLMTVHFDIAKSLAVVCCIITGSIE